MIIQKISHKPYDLMAQKTIEGGSSTENMNQMQDKNKKLKERIDDLKKERDDLIARWNSGDSSGWLGEELGYLHGRIERMEEELKTSGS